jgi:hypothetical protein
LAIVLEKPILVAAHARGTSSGASLTSTRRVCLERVAGPGLRCEFLLAMLEGGFHCIHERNIEVHSAVVFDFVFICSYGLDIDDGIVIFGIEVTAEPSSDYFLLWGDILVDEVLSAGHFCHVQLYLRVCRGNRQKRQQPT